MSCAGRRKTPNATACQDPTKETTEEKKLPVTANGTFKDRFVELGSMRKVTRQDSTGECQLAVSLSWYQLVFSSDLRYKALSSSEFDIVLYPS
jgi:hypothetical protein